MKTKIAAVAVISFFENVMYQKILVVEDTATWKDVLILAVVQGIWEGESKSYTKDEGYLESLKDLPKDQDEARQECYEQEMEFKVTFYEQ